MRRANLSYMWIFDCMRGSVPSTPALSKGQLWINPEPKLHQNPECMYVLKSTRVLGLHGGDLNIEVAKHLQIKHFICKWWHVQGAEAVAGRAPRHQCRDLGNCGEDSHLLKYLFPTHLSWVLKFYHCWIHHLTRSTLSLELQNKTKAHSAGWHTKSQ